MAKTKTIGTNPADRVEQWPVEKLIPYARNARTHSAAQVAQLAASIREWGWTTPILVSPDGGVIAGHGRLLAARQLGMVNVPVIVAEGWSEPKTRAYVLADNQLALQAGWDNELLALELGELGELGFDLDLTGFGEGEIAALTPGGTEGLDGDAPSPRSLSDRFLLPPFSVLNAREGWWQDRKRAWLALGIKSELGRGGELAGFIPGGQGINMAAAMANKQRQEAAPGPRVTYSKKQRGNGAGRPIE